MILYVFQEGDRLATFTEAHERFGCGKAVAGRFIEIPLTLQNCLGCPKLSTGLKGVIAGEIHARALGADIRVEHYELPRSRNGLGEVEPRHGAFPSAQANHRFRHVREHKRLAV